MSLQGGALAHLTALQELRLSPGAGFQTFNLQLAGLPPSLRRLEVVNCREPLDPYPKLVVEAPAPLPAPPWPVSAPMSAPHLASTGIRAGGSAASPASSASSAAAGNRAAWTAIPPTLDSVVLDYLLMALPAPWPLPASCAVTLRTAFLTLRGEHAPAIGSDCERV